MTIKVAKQRKVPSTVQAINYEVNGTTTQLEWQPVTDANLSYYAIRHAVETTNAKWSDATTAVEKVSRPANSVSVPARAGTYMIKAYSKGGKPSADYASVVVPATDLNSYSQTITQAEHPNFTGNKVGLTVSSNKIFNTTGSTATIVRYDFSTHIETHDNTVRLVNIRIDANVARKDLTNGLFDALPNDFDDLPTGYVHASTITTGFDNVHTAEHHKDCNLIYEVAMTDDDPNGSPTYTDFKQFRAGQFRGRAFKFRVFFRSTSDGFSPEVSNLTAVVEY